VSTCAVGAETTPDRSSLRDGCFWVRRLGHERAPCAPDIIWWSPRAAELARAFLRVHLLRDAAVAVPQLVEMAADDAADSRTAGSPVAAALVAFAARYPSRRRTCRRVPSAVTGVQRLLRPASSLGWAGTAATVVVAFTFLAVPAVAAMAPAWPAGLMPDYHLFMTR
jgi:hypothetical protein